MEIFPRIGLCCRSRRAPNLYAWEIPRQKRGRDNSDTIETAMIRQMVLRNVVHRPVRTMVSVLAVAVEVTLVIIIVGLTSGMLQETAKRIEGVGADVLVQPPSASVFLAFSGAPMPVRIGDRLRE